jgi:hypothetical protein
MPRIKKTLAAVTASALLTVSAAGPAAAQQTQNGLVNVAVDNVIVQVPIGVAANVCGVNAAVIAANFTQTATPVCNAQNNQLPVAFQI